MEVQKNEEEAEEDTSEHGGSKVSPINNFILHRSKRSGFAIKIQPNSLDEKEDYIK